MKKEGSEFSASVAKEADATTQIITLNYESKDNAAKSMSVAIAPELGSNMFRFRVGNNEVLYCDQELLRNYDFTGNFVLWPIPNRVRGKRYTFQGKDYSLQDVKRPRGNDVLIHGFVFDREWQFDEPSAEDASVSVETHIDITPESPHYASYPFNSRLTLRYVLSEQGVKIAYTVKNNSDKELPFGFGLHPYFSILSGQDGTRVMLPADYVMEADEDLLPTGKLIDVTNTEFDLRQPTPLRGLQLDHVFTGLHRGQAAYIDYSIQGMKVYLDASDDFTHMVLYTLEKEKGFICFENQTCSTDAINLDNQGLKKEAHLLTLPPGESHSGYINYIIEHN